MCGLRCCLLLSSIVVAILAAIVAVPSVQRAVIHVHFVPGLHTWYGKLHQPQSTWGVVGARAVYLQHPNGERVGLWHILPSGHAAAQAPREGDPSQTQYFDAQLRDGCIAIYFHGNGFARHLGHRLGLYSLLTSHIGCHVVAPDWRGYGDSSGAPSQSAQLEDARLVWDWVTGLAPPRRIVIWGHSLGGAVSNLFCADLLHRGSDMPAGLLLHSTFVTMREVAFSLPFTKPLALLPGFTDVFDRYWTDHYLARDAVAETASAGLPIMIIHGDADLTVEAWHGRALHEATNGTASLVIFEGGAHNDLETVHAPKLARETLPWFRSIGILG